MQHLSLMSLLCGLSVDEGLYLGTHVPSALTMIARRTLGVHDIALYLSSSTVQCIGLVLGGLRHSNHNTSLIHSELLL